MVAPGSAQRGDQIASRSAWLIQPVAWRCAMLLWLVAGVLACGDDDGVDGSADAAADAEPDAGPGPVRARFELAEGPMAFGAIPWPDDLYRDTDGDVRVRALGGAQADVLAEAYATLDGFGLRPVITFGFDAAIDPDSLPSTPEDTLAQRAAVFLIDADTGSPQAFQRIEADVGYTDADGHRILVRPAHSRALVPGRRYAAGVTRSVDSEGGRPVEASERFAAIRDPDQTLADSLDRRAREQYSPVLETLDTQGVSRESVVAMAVFQAQSVGTDLADAHARVWSGLPPELSVGRGVRDAELDAILGTPADDAIGLDAAGGAPHMHVGAIVHGILDVPNLVSADDRGYGAFERRSNGELRERGTLGVPFTLILPRVVEQGLPLPVVIIQHGLGGERSDALAVADRLAASGYASLALDAPHHGLLAATDETNRFTGEESQDGFGDAVGDLLGITARDAPLGPMHPFYYRDGMRQGAVALMVAVRAIVEGDWSDLSVTDPSFEGLAFDGDRIGFVGIDLGAEMGVMLAGYEPRVGALVLAFCDGLGVDGWLDAPARKTDAEALMDHLGRDRALLDSPDAGYDAQVDAFRALAERGTAAAHAPAMRRSNANVLLLMALDDELAPNRGTEGLAYALGADTLAYEPRHVPDLVSRVVVTGDTRSGNFEVDDDAVTRMLVALDPASHSSLVLSSGERRYRAPFEPPFSELDPPQPVANPIDAVLTNITFFFESWRACEPPAPTSTCAASVMAP